MKSISLFILFAGFLAQAEINYSLNLGLRSKPLNLNIIGQAAYDGMLWGERKPGDPLYGYYRAGIRGGGSPTAAVFFQVAPIAPLIFEVQKGIAKRFFTKNSFNCDSVDCEGQVDRTDYLVKFGLAHNDFVLMGQVNWRDIKTEDSNQAIALELENFLVTPGTHNYFEAITLVGYKLPDDRLAGILLSSGQISNGHQRFTSGYAVYRFKWNDYSVMSGVGSYKSDYNRMTGVSLIFTLTRTWGESLSLF